MHRLLFTILMFCAHTVCAQQSFSCTFSGVLEHTETLETNILKIAGIRTCKIRLKPEKSAGEILFELEPYIKNEEFPNPSPLIDLKKVLSESGLTLQELTERHP